MGAISSVKDKNPNYRDMTYYKVFKEIWKLNYHAFQIPVFKCDWVESYNGIKIDKLGFTCLNLSKVGYKDDPFIWAFQMNQVFYVDDPMESGWSIAFLAKPRNISPNNDQDEVETLEELNTTNIELVEIDYSEGPIGSYARKDIDGV